jgi:hypothetical protein
MVQILYAVFAEVSWLLIGFCVGGFGACAGFTYFQPPKLIRKRLVPYVRGRMGDYEMEMRQEAEGAMFTGMHISFVIVVSASVCALISACVAAFYLDSPMSTRLNVCGTVNAALLLAVFVFARNRMLARAREEEADIDRQYRGG